MLANFLLTDNLGGLHIFLSDFTENETSSGKIRSIDDMIRLGLAVTSRFKNLKSF